MLRVHFEADDLARTKVSEGPDPLWETVLSLHRLQERGPEPALTAWRHHASRYGPGPLRVLLPLVPPRGYFPDFLTPSAGAAGLGHGLEAVLSTPRRRLRAELPALAAGVGLPGWTRGLADGEVPALRRLASALRAYHEAALRPSWWRVAARVEAERTLRAHTQLWSGADAMLSGFGPAMRWRPPVLEVDYPFDKDVHLGGRGLLLTPSYFCRRTPVMLADPALPPVLVYPAPPLGATRVNSPSGGAAARREEQLARLLGHSRAAALEALAEHCATTTELARRAGLSVSSASEHAAVLREGGLISSVRVRNSVRHAVTPLGARLLSGAEPGRQPPR
ncbi:winged helix-turn-helix domain-containing protein [Streptomyces sp. NPDC059009]|uniref:helix-turn-helix domain-containing protein n=1 Tax=Streptomyces sp. NPDC059009 TaxID=3346694 RepID=UPI0036946C6D